MSDLDVPQSVDHRSYGEQRTRKDLPVGTLTFLFTDNEDSVTWARKYGSTIHALEDRNIQIIREAVERNRGAIYKRVGDALQIVFASARSAVAAAYDAQRALAAQDLGEVGGFAVRFVLHTGEVARLTPGAAPPPDMNCVLDNGDYIGHLLDVCGRLLGLCGGGQVLLSATTAALVEKSVPTGAQLRDEGLFLFRGFPEPQRSINWSH